MSAVAAAHHHLTEALDELRQAAESGLASDGELLSVLTVSEGLTRQLEHLTVTTTATLQRRGAFAERGYKDTTGALADLLNCDRFEARRRVTAAEQACERIGIDGTAVPAQLPATAKVFAAGQASLRHVNVIAGLLATAAAGRLTDGQRAGVEEELAAKTGEFRPADLRRWGSQLIEALDDDGPEPHDTPPASINELHLRRQVGAFLGGFERVAQSSDSAAGSHPDEPCRPWPCGGMIVESVRRRPHVADTAPIR